MGKENQRPPASPFLFIITPLFPQRILLSACVLCVLVCLYPLSPSATWRIYDICTPYLFPQVAAKLRGTKQDFGQLQWKHIQTHAKGPRTFAQVYLLRRSGHHHQFCFYRAGHVATMVGSTSSTCINLKQCIVRGKYRSMLIVFNLSANGHKQMTDKNIWIVGGSKTKRWEKHKTRHEKGTRQDEKSTRQDMRKDNKRSKKCPPNYTNQNINKAVTRDIFIRPAAVFSLECPIWKCLCKYQKCLCK